MLIVLALALAEPAVCSVLGGRHVSNGCTGEWGGNGDNDPDNNGDDPWPWTNSSPDVPWYWPN